MIIKRQMQTHAPIPTFIPVVISEVVVMAVDVGTGIGTGIGEVIGEATGVDIEEPIIYLQNKINFIIINLNVNNFYFLILKINFQKSFIHI